MIQLVLLQLSSETKRALREFRGNEVALEHKLSVASSPLVQWSKGLFIDPELRRNLSDGLVAVRSFMAETPNLMAPFADESERRADGSLILLLQGEFAFGN